MTSCAQSPLTSHTKMLQSAMMRMTWTVSIKHTHIASLKSMKAMEQAPPVMIHQQVEGPPSFTEHTDRPSKHPQHKTMACIHIFLFFLHLQHICYVPCSSH